MGGMGSGNWFRYDTKTTIEAALRIDVRYLRRQGLLSAGYSGTLNWTCRNEPSGEINFECWQDRLVLNFQCSRHGSNAQSIKQTIEFERTPCRFGGERCWFLCPQRDRRCEVLCFRQQHFFCRLCQDLPYRSQMKSQLDRWIDQRDNVEDKLWGKNRRRWRKPKLERLMWQHQHLDQAVDQTLARYVKMLQIRLPKR